MASRPYMPDYGVVGPDDGSGLLPWSWAEAQLDRSRNYWLATAWPDGQPHVMPVWAVWDGRTLAFSAGLHARKIRNLLDDPRCVITTEDPLNPVVAEGVAELVTADDGRQAYLDGINAKYDTSYEMDFLDPSTTAVFRIRLEVAFGLLETDFTGSPTRWDLTGI